MSIDLFAPGTLSLIALIAARVGGLLLIAPFFSAHTIPVMVRTGLLLALVMLLLPLASQTVVTAAVTPGAMLNESLIGMALGFGAALMVAGAELAGDVLGTQSGLSGATTLDPMTQTGGTPVFAQFSKLLVVTLILALDGHLLMLEALSATFSLLPVGAPIDATGGAAAVVALTGDLFVLGATFAAPVTAAVFIGNVALGVLARATPQLNIFMVAYPLQIAIGLVTFGLALPLIVAGMGQWNGMYETTVLHLVRALGGAS